MLVALSPLAASAPPKQAIRYNPTVFYMRVKNDFKAYGGGIYRPTGECESPNKINHGALCTLRVR